MACSGQLAAKQPRAGPRPRLHLIRFHGVLALPEWFVAIHLTTQSTNGVSALELKHHVGVSWPTAWMMKHKLLEVIFEHEAGRQLTGRVEIDDSYLGGEYHGGKPGRGSPNKNRFVAAVQTSKSVLM